MITLLAVVICYTAYPAIERAPVLLFLISCGFRCRLSLTFRPGLFLQPQSDNRMHGVRKGKNIMSGFEALCRGIHVLLLSSSLGPKVHDAVDKNGL